MGLSVNNDAYNAEFLASYKRKYNNISQGYATSPSISDYEYDSFVSEKGNKCTDGKDDGKIGLLSTVGNIVQGAGKCIINTVKGAFFDENGFSATRALTTIGIGILCLNCPAVGFALGGLGIATSGIKIAKSVVKASGAKSDTEAKDAYEELGEGGLTMGLSILGTKASYGALKTRGTELSALGKDFNPLKDFKSFTEWSKALWKDSKSTTIDGLANIKNSVIGQFKANKELKAATKNLKRAEKMAETDLSDNFNDLDTAQTAQADLQDAKYRYSDAKAAYNKTTIGKIKNSEVVENISKAYKSPFKTASSTAKGAWNLAGKVLKNIKEEGFKETVNLVGSKLGSTGKNILAALKDGSKDYNQLVAEYGYENVCAVLKTIGAYRNLDQTM